MLHVISTWCVARDLHTIAPSVLVGDSLRCSEIVKHLKSCLWRWLLLLKEWQKWNWKLDVSLTETIPMVQKEGRPWTVPCFQQSIYLTLVISCVCCQTQGVAISIKGLAGLDSVTRWVWSIASISVRQHVKLLLSQQICSGDKLCTLLGSEGAKNTHLLQPLQNNSFYLSVAARQTAPTLADLFRR